MRVVADGKMEALLYSFPSSLDGGRAINISAPDWQGQVLYDRFKDAAQHEGNRLNAMIINVPGGIPGDVGFFLS